MKMFVVPRPRGWAVEAQNKQISRTYKDKKRAVEWARNHTDNVVELKRKRPVQHVVPKQGSWAVRCEKCLRVSRVYPERLQAVLKAEEFATNQKGEVVLHDELGRIQDRWEPEKIDYVDGELVMWNYLR